MRRGLLVVLVLVLSVILMSCTEVKIHENVDEEVAKDAMQLMDVVVKNVSKKTLYEDASNNDKNVIDTYYSKYMGQFSTKRNLYDGVNEDILIIANSTTLKYMDGITLETEKSDLKDSEIRLKEFIKTGEGYNLEVDTGSDEENLSQREGVSDEVVGAARYYYVLIKDLLDKEIYYDDLDESNPELDDINAYHSDNYKGANEEYSLEEKLLISRLDFLIYDYTLKDVSGYSVEDLYSKLRELNNAIEEVN